VQEELARLGLPQEYPGQSYEGKLIAEYKLADYVVVPSGYARTTFLREGFEANRIFVVPYGTDIHQPPPRRVDDPYRILFVGRVTPRKGFTYLLEAFQALNGVQCELTVVGDCDDNLRHLVKNMPPRAKYLGNLARVDLADEYRRASVFVLPSLADAQPLVVLEAMAHGLPVIVTDHCGSTDFVRDGQEGFVVGVRDVAALVDRLQLLADDPSLRRRMGLIAGARAKTLTWQHYGEALLRVYHTILARSRL
jgi:glycosyltransferase involved in cell wall biosynthesis